MKTGKGKTTGKEYPWYIQDSDAVRAYYYVMNWPYETRSRGLLDELSRVPGVRIKIYQRKISLNDFKKMYRTYSCFIPDDNHELENEEQKADYLLKCLTDNPKDMCGMSVYVRLRANNYEELKLLEKRVMKMTEAIDVTLSLLVGQQRQGETCMRSHNVLVKQTESFLSHRSLINFYPSGYHEKLDAHGFFLGKTDEGETVQLDLMERSRDVTNGNVLILGNSGEGKSHLLIMLLAQSAARGKRVILIDPEGEYRHLTQGFQGQTVDFQNGHDCMNPLDIRMRMNDDTVNVPMDAQLSFLKAFFGISRKMNPTELDALEMVLLKLYESFGWTRDQVGQEVPTIEDLDKFLQRSLEDDSLLNYLAKDMKTSLLLAIQPLSQGSQRNLFCGETNIEPASFMTFDLRSLSSVDTSLRDAMLFTALSYMEHELLVMGDAVGAVDELYLLLSNRYAIESLRNLSKRVRKHDSCLLLCSQNPEDFMQSGIAELTKPLFSIPSHSFLFYGGVTDKKAYMDMLSLSEAEYQAIDHPARGHCLYRCGNERYTLNVDKGYAF